MAWLGKPSVQLYNDIHVNFLPLNYAYVILNTTLENIGLYSVSEDCYRCPYKRQRDPNNYHAEKTAVYKVYTGEQTKWRILNHIEDDYIQPDYKRGLLCELKPTLGEYGVYKLDIGKCSMDIAVPPVNVYLPLLFFSIILLIAITALSLVKLFLRRNNEARYNDGLDLTAKRDNYIMPSLHFLRGLLLILIMFVTTGGGGYPIFSRNYGGLTVADCLLFAYILSIGMKAPAMFEEDSKRAISKASMICVVLMRSIVLMFLGIAISSTAPRSRYLATPVWAPLACIAIAYFVVAVFYIIGTSNNNTKPKNTIGTAGNLFWSWLLGAFLLIIMILSIHMFYNTQCKEYAKFDARRNSWMANGNNCQDNDVFSEVFNKNLLGVNRDEPFYVDSYYAFTKGLLGVISSILTALIGLKAGVIYIQNEDHKTKMKQWCFWGTAFGVAGIILAALSGPINFNIWPVSSILLISSLTLFVYIFVYYLTEIRQINSSIISTCGIASIPILSGHLLFSHSFPFYWGEHLDTHFFYLWQSAWVVFLWIVIAICWLRLRVNLITKVSNDSARRAMLAW